jgi:hypothetical protein
MNSKAPYMCGTVKLHKEHEPIRPIDNWKDSPGYKLAKYVATQLSQKLQLPYVYNVKDSIMVIRNLENLQIDGNTRLCSFDIENTYTNIPVSEIKNIISGIRNNDNKTPTFEKQELGILQNTIIKHNYTQCSDQFYNQD